MQTIKKRKVTQTGNETPSNSKHILRNRNKQQQSGAWSLRFWVLYIWTEASVCLSSFFIDIWGSVLGWQLPELRILKKAQSQRRKIRKLSDKQTEIQEAKTTFFKHEWIWGTEWFQRNDTEMMPKWVSTRTKPIDIVPFKIKGYVCVFSNNRPTKSLPLIVPDKRAGFSSRHQECQSETPLWGVTPELLRSLNKQQIVWQHLRCTVSLKRFRIQAEKVTLQGEKQLSKRHLRFNYVTSQIQNLCMFLLLVLTMHLKFADYKRLFSFSCFTILSMHFCKIHWLPGGHVTYTSSCGCVSFVVG